MIYTPMLLSTMMFNYSFRFLQSYWRIGHGRLTWLKVLDLLVWTNSFVHFVRIHTSHREELVKQACLRQGQEILSSRPSSWAKSSRTAGHKDHKGILALQGIVNEFISNWILLTELNILISSQVSCCFVYQCLHTDDLNASRMTSSSALFYIHLGFCSKATP